MPDIVIPEAVWDEFFQSLHVQVTRELEEFRARLAAREAVLRAQLNAGLESKMRKAEEIERRVLAAKERTERMMRAADEEIERMMNAAADQIARKRREAEDEIARLRQLERLRQTAAIERGEWPQ